jgi:predicted SprT family Zn-dependent metalloprotease
MPKPSPNPTTKTYSSLDEAFAFFNARLFEGRLPACLITMQRSKSAYGYFAGGRFGSKDGQEVTDEIALNPSHFRDRSTEQSLSTLVHEMTHLEQHHFGKPSRAGYHNKQWAGMMKAVGLIPSDTGAPGGKEIGQKVTHYIEAGGPFERACAELVKKGFNPLYVELWTEAGEKTRKKKAASKTRYTCPQCQTNAWAKPDVKLICGECDERMLAEGDDGDSDEGEDV